MLHSMILIAILQLMKLKQLHYCKTSHLRLKRHCYSKSIILIFAWSNFRWKRFPKIDSIIFRNHEMKKTDGENMPVCKNVQNLINSKLIYWGSVTTCTTLVHSYSTNKANLLQKDPLHPKYLHPVSLENLNLQSSTSKNTHLQS